MSKIHKPSLLIVEDDDGVRRTTQDVLMNEHFCVDTACSGEEAIALGNSRAYDLVLLDLKLPDMNGREVLKTLHASSPATDFMVFTGQPDIYLAVELLKLGAKEYVVKPAKAEEIVRRVKSALRTQQADQRLKQLHAEFSSKFLYDLRTPLASAALALDVLKKDLSGKLSEQQLLVVESMKSSLNKMNTLLGNMIDLTLFESGSVDIEKIPTNLDEVVPSIIRRMKPLALANKISINLNVVGNIPTIEVDPERIEQVMMNLVDNAIRFSKEDGAVHITLSAKHQRFNGTSHEYVEIAVSDMGMGIAKEELALIFDKYKDVLTGKSDQQKPTGLGLAICKSIIDAHHGTITVESSPGKGCTFRIFLPLNAA